MANKKLQVWLPLILSVVLIGGMFFGFKLRENTPSGNGFFKRDKKTSLQEILDLVRQRYVDPVRLDSLQYSAIDEMMDHLDPHSIFIPASNLQEVNEDLLGNFEGIDRKSTRLNSSHSQISYAVFCLKKKKKKKK